VKKVNIIVGVLVVVLVVIFSSVSNRTEPKPAYNAASEMRVHGTIQEVEEFFCPVTEDRGVHLHLKTASGIIMVHVGIGRVLRSNNIRFSVGDQVEVLGSKIKYQGADSVIAREITRGDDIFILRDQNGNPRLN